MSHTHAEHMAQTGYRTAVVERQLIGGSCPNTNGLPSKKRIWSAKVADLVRRALRAPALPGVWRHELARVS